MSDFRRDRLRLGSKVGKATVILFGQLLCVLLIVDVVFGVNVKALRISREADGRHNRALVSPLEQRIPVDTIKKGMGLDLGSTTIDVAKAPRPIDCTELVDNILGGGRDGWILGKYNGCLQDSGKQSQSMQETVHSGRVKKGI